MCRIAIRVQTVDSLEMESQRVENVKLFAIAASAYLISKIRNQTTCLHDMDEIDFICAACLSSIGILFLSNCAKSKIMPQVHTCTVQYSI